MDLDVAFRAHAEAETQEVRPVRSAHRTLLFVHLQAQPALDETTSRGQNPISGAFAAHEDLRIVGIANKAQPPSLQLPIQLVQDDIGQERRQWPALGRSLFGAYPRAVRQRHLRLQHQPHKVQDAFVFDPLPDPTQQTLMMNTVEELGYVYVDNDPASVPNVPFCLGNGSACTATGAEPVAAGVEGRLEDRLQNLEHGLLHHTVHHIGNTQSPLPAAGLGDPDPTYIARPVASRQQLTTQHRKQARSFLNRFLHAATVHTGRALVARDVQKRPCQIRQGRHPFQQSRRADCCGGETLRLPAVRYVQQVRLAVGCVRRRLALAPLRAVGEREPQLALSVTFSTHHSLRSTGFHRFPGYYEVIRLLCGLRASVVAFASPYRTCADPQRPPGVRLHNVLPPPSSLPSCHGWIRALR